MILADVRHRLTRDDAQLAMRLISRGDDRELQQCEDALRERGIDALLEDPRLMPALLAAPQGALASYPLFAYVAVRHALHEVGEENRGLADYMAAILIAFGDKGRAERVAPSDDEHYDTLAALAQDVDDADARRSLLVRAHLGNYALWLAGLFPDFIERRRWRKGGPDLEYYDEMGKRGFQLAADHRLAEQHGLSALYAMAALRFEVMRAALNNVSDRLLFPNVHTPERLMRQVATGFRLQ
ncbi:MAG: hypothetical protein HOQ11_10145 [Gemmatimonadaceae bacterium]|nr:hypothetical protein [Gemmatimonadaceae bacterium]NUQ94481.1 hypothetical protein [Gemmatimonadaceae bacterium]NUR19340.1 hypothetical protein [Gemmatimonadaceae bacterium]NUS97751.1 hypothetical protein [Gemmatimonadaceae bacterium]